MKALIAAATLAVSTTAASAAVYELNFTATATDVPDFFSHSVSPGEVDDASLTFSTDGFPETFQCNVFGYGCFGGSPADVSFDSDGELTSFSTLMAGFDRPLILNFATGTGSISQDDPGLGAPGPGTVVSLRFDITETNVTVIDDGPDVAPVPLPASAPLLAMGLGGLAWWRRRAA